ncbi:MAG: inorganic phosphate transporter, partial [Thermodesulfobacteriota bacterium]
MFAIFLTSGLFLGWSLGANDAANVFGTAVGTRMISFRKAAIFCGIFVIFGAVISGAGAAQTLGELGAVNAIAGAFVVALAAAVTVYWLTVLGYPVSTTQAIVGAIIGWDLFSGALIDFGALEKIVLSWFISPILAAIFSALLYKVIAFGIKYARIHMFSLDALTRSGLLLAGIALTLGVMAAVGTQSLIVIPPGHRGVVFNRVSGVRMMPQGEGFNFLIPFVEQSIILDVRVQKDTYDA